jgi:hypothetical protein
LKKYEQVSFLYNIPFTDPGKKERVSLNYRFFSHLASHIPYAVLCN